MQKAYDTVNWTFLREMLMSLDFPVRFVDLVMECVCTPMYSLMIDAELHGYLHLREGLDRAIPYPLSFL